MVDHAVEASQVEVTRRRQTAVISNMSGSLPVVTLEEMSKHTAKNDIWMAHDGTVYDVTKFLDEHPGGPEIMLEHAGEPCERRLR